MVSVSYIFWHKLGSQHHFSSILVKIAQPWPNHEKTSDKSSLRTFYEIADWYSSKVSGHEREERLTNCHGLEKTKNTLKPNAIWNPAFDPGT